MGTELFDSIVSKLAVHIPMFAKPILEAGLKREGANPWTATPTQIKRAVEGYVIPRLRSFKKGYQEIGIMGGGLIKTSSENRVISLSPGVYQYFEMEENLKVEDQRFFSKLKDVGLVLKVEEIAKQNKEILIKRLNIEKPSRSILEVSFFLMHDEQGKPIGTISYISDITLPEVLHEEAVTLYDKLDKSSSDLQVAQDHLLRSERLAALGQLAAGMAHELRNPIGAIKNSVYFLNLELPNPSPKIKECLAILEKEAATSERIISGLLDFAAPKPLVQRETRMEDILKETLARTDVPDNIEIITHIEEGLPITLTAPDQISQVFRNLIQNGIQAMPEGGKLIIRCRLQPPRTIAISFADFGVGIPATNIEKIFEPLFTTKAKGIGLGLSLTKTLVERHRGTIEVRSRVGQGSTFTVRLPLSG